VIEVRAFARLHFGLMNVGAAPPWENLDGERINEGRRFGGVGLMIDAPRLILRARPSSSTWSAQGSGHERILATVQRLIDPSIKSAGFGSSVDLPPQQFEVIEALPEHAGFGSGTQLELAVARTLLALLGRSDYSAADLACWTGRGRRSAVGVHGFAHGGLIVEAGKRGDEGIAPLVVHAVLPEEWRIVTVLPAGHSGLHGDAECRAFDQLPASDSARDRLCRLVLLEMIPALRVGDFPMFAEAVYEFNARVGELFAPIQGGRYAQPLIADGIRKLRCLGVRGVGQSSWGPAIFALVEDEDRAGWLRKMVEGWSASARCWIGRAAGPACLLRS